MGTESSFRFQVVLVGVLVLVLETQRSKAQRTMTSTRTKFANSPSYSGGGPQFPDTTPEYLLTVNDLFMNSHELADD